MAKEKVIEAEKLVKLVTKLFEKQGVPNDVADIVADSLVAADLRGVNSHGVMRVPLYMSRVAHNVVSAAPDITVEKDFGAMALLDAHDTFGQVAGKKAMEKAIEKAEQFGIGCVGVKGSHHFGMAAYYSMMAAEKGMIGISTTNTDAMIPPPGGAAKMLGNNPIAFAVPSGKYDSIVLDMACSTVAHGKIQMYALRGLPIPEGWATDINGNPTTDAEEGAKGMLAPVGGPKGYGLAVIMDILSGVLTGSDYGTGVSRLINVFDRTQNCGHFFIAIDVSKFMSMDLFKERIDDYTEKIKACPKAEGYEEVFLPGEIEAKNNKKNSREGITLPETIFDELRKLANEYGVDADKYLD